MGRAPCCDKANVKKGPWSPEEDAKLKAYIEQNGTGGNWIALPQKIGLKRCGKSCRLRWLNYLRPNIKHGGFSEEEDNIICSLYINIGSRWSIIAAQLPGRTDNDIKNYWNTRLKKKLLGKQRKEQAAAQARRANDQKHDQVKRESSTYDYQNINLPHDGLFSNQTVPYWPDLPAVQTVPVLNSQSSYVDGSNISQLKDSDNGNHQQHASIRNLLIKLGGRFSETASTTTTTSTSITIADHFHSGTNYAMDQLSGVQDQAYSFDMLSNNYGVEAVGPTMYEGLENLQAELRELIYSNNPQQVVLLDGTTSSSEDFYGMEQIIAGSTTTTATTATTGTSTSSVDSGSWGETNSSSLVYPTSMVSEYGNLYQTSHQDSAFEELSYFRRSNGSVNACGV